MECLAKKQTVLIRPSKGLLSLELNSLWKYRELLYFLVWREIKVRYKQTAIGAAWAIIQPLVTMLIFTAVFGIFAKIPSDDLPYPVFAFTALVPWAYFAQALSLSGGSLVGDARLMTKIYFPRLLIPFSAVVAPGVDFVLSFIVLLGLMAWFGIVPTWGVALLPLFLMLALIVALGVGLWLSPLNVRYRDVRHTIPFLVQVWMYASPIVYPVSLVPERWQYIYCLNPMVGVIEGFRWALLGKGAPDVNLLLVSALGAVVLLVGGLIFFKQMEKTFADIV
jgi:lipopolysaccharide transport system permease protein